MASISIAIGFALPKRIDLMFSASLIASRLMDALGFNGISFFHFTFLKLGLKFCPKR